MKNRVQHSETSPWRDVPIQLALPHDFPFEVSDFPSDYRPPFLFDRETGDFYAQSRVKTHPDTPRYENLVSRRKSRKHPLQAWIRVAAGAYWTFEIIDLVLECRRSIRKSRTA